MANIRNRGFSGFRTNSVPMDIAAPYTAPRVPGQGGVPSGLPQEVPVYLPENFPIPGANEFNPMAFKATIGPEVNTDIGIVLELPPNSAGILRGVSLYISDMLATTVVTWSVTQNNGVLPGYANLQIFPRVSPFVSNGFDAFVRLDTGPVRVVFTNTDGGAYTVGAALSGWFWPEVLGKKWLEQGPAL